VIANLTGNRWRIPRKFPSAIVVIIKDRKKRTSSPNLLNKISASAPSELTTSVSPGQDHDDQNNDITKTINVKNTDTTAKANKRTSLSTTPKRLDNS